MPELRKEAEQQAQTLRERLDHRPRLSLAQVRHSAHRLLCQKPRELPACSCGTVRSCQPSALLAYLTLFSLGGLWANFS